MSSLFCRHNRFTAECPICSKGSVLERGGAAERRAPAPKRASSSPRRSGGRAVADASARTFQGPYVSVGPLDRGARIYEVRLEKVPGGLRLAEWRGGALERHAPVLPAASLRELLDDARGRGLIGFDVPDAVLAGDGVAASAGQAGDMREELRADEPGMVRVGRYVYWPGDRIWELQESPVLVPEQRFEEALTKAAELGLF